MASHLEFEQWVPSPLEHVFAFFSNPENLPRLMPTSSGTKLIALNRVPAPPSPSGNNGYKAAGVGSSKSARLVTDWSTLPRISFRALF
jgi:hypothetical protein